MSQKGNVGLVRQRHDRENEEKRRKNRAKLTLLWSLALVAVCVVWGSGFTVVKIAMSEADPVVFVALRFVIASCALGLLSIGRFHKMTLNMVMAGFFLALPVSVGFLTQTIGLNSTTASNAGFITGMSVIFTPILAAIFLKKKTSLLAIIGVVLATAGLGFLSMKGSFKISGGDMLVLICAFSFAVHIIILDRYSNKYDGVLLAFLQVAWVAVITVAFSFNKLGEILTYSDGTLFAVSYLGVFGTAIAYFVQTLAQKYTSPVGTSLIFQTEVVFTVIFAYFFLNEVLSPLQWFGATLIISGVLLCQFNDIRKTRLELS